LEEEEPSESTEHVNGILKPEVTGVVSAFYRGGNYAIFLVVGDSQKISVDDPLKNLNTYVLNTGFFAFH
jgi:hypothetical protein